MRKLSLLLLLLAGAVSAQQQVVNIGAAPDDGTGDPARTAFDKLNDNDTQLYTRTAGAALTKTDDTNVTLTLGGAPTTALLNATSLTLGWTGDLAFSRLTQGSALSVLGVTGNATADFASIAAGSDGNVLRRSGTALAFGAISLSSSNAVTGTLPVANGGTNLTASADDNVMVGNGTTWETKALTSCSAASSAVTYNTSTNAFGCNTISSGATETTGTFSVTPTGCSDSFNATWTYTKIGNNVTIRWPLISMGCTSNSTSFGSQANAFPSTIRPAAQINFCGTSFNDNGTTSTLAGGFSLSTAGTLTFNNTTTGSPCGSSTWTNSGGKAFASVGTSLNSFSYTIN